MFFTDRIRGLSAGATIVAIVALAVLAGCERSPAPAGPAPAADAPPPASAAETATPAAGDEPARPVDAETLPYAELDEELVYGFFAVPADMIEPLPAIIVIHDWWGLDDGVRAAATHLAGLGYIVFAIDLYGGTTVDDVAEARKRMISVLENPEAVRENVSQAIEFVRIAGAPSIATLGWGLGGTWSLNAALSFPQAIDATVVFYGQVIDDERRLAALEAPVLGLFGADDRTLPLAGVRAFEEALQRLEKPHLVKIYDDAGHRFAARGRDSFAPEAATAAWQDVETFLDEHLAGSAAD